MILESWGERQWQAGGAKAETQDLRGGREIETEMADKVMETERDTKTETETRRKVPRPREWEADK